MADFVLVHGAGTGGWLWDAVADGAPQATGVHNDAEHRPQVVASGGFSDPSALTARRWCLVGFSYGGLVVCGAAERLGPPARWTIYLDAFLPRPNQSFFDLLPETVQTTMQRAADQFGAGRRIPPTPIEAVGGSGRLEAGVDRLYVEQLLTRRGFQPLRSYTKPYPGTGTTGPRTVFISCTDKPANDPLLAVAKRLAETGWDVRKLPTGHFSMLTMPEALTEILLEIAES